jgi:hypothetical protein
VCPRRHVAKKEEEEKKKDSRKNARGGWIWKAQIRVRSREDRREASKENNFTLLMFTAAGTERMEKP